MRIPLISMFMTSPFEALKEHAEIVKDCAWTFQQAMECHISKKCQRFEDLRQEIIELERKADSVKRRIRGHIPIGTVMPVAKFQLFRYLREQDNVLDAVEDTLDWISFREDPGIPKPLQKDCLVLVDKVIDSIDDMTRMVGEAHKYFKSYSENQRIKVKEIIRDLRRNEHQADRLEQEIKKNVLNANLDPVTVFHMVRLVEYIGSIADHAENAGDMMRAMIAK